MLKRLLTGIAAATLLAPLSVYALGLGQIEVRSALSQVMDGEIPVIGAAPGDAAIMRVRLAPSGEFKRAGLVMVLGTLTRIAARVFWGGN